MHSSMLAISLIILVAAIGLFVIVGWHNSKTRYSNKKPQITNVFVTNLSSISRDVILDNERKFTVDPEGNITIPLDIGDKITVSSTKYGISRTFEMIPGITNVYLGEDQIYNNLNASFGKITNSSEQSVDFVEVGGNNSRWVQYKAAPLKSRGDFLFGEGSVWQVADPEQEKKILAQTKIGKGVHTLIYDGKSLKGLSN